MPKGSIDKATRNQRYAKLRSLGATRQEAKQGMDFRRMRYAHTIGMMTTGHTYAQANKW